MGSNETILETSLEYPTQEECNFYSMY
jgi:hypothetical protein